MRHRHLIVDASLIGSAIAVGTTLGVAATLPITATAIALHTWGVVSPRSRWYLPLHWRLPAGTTDLALSFDDGPDPEITPRLLDLLAAHGARATFFCIGRNVADHPALARRITDEGHALGLHSHDHDRRFNCFTPRRVAADLEANAAALADATGRPPPRLWRPPMGLKNPWVAEAAHRLDLLSVTWSCRGLDTGRRGPELVAARLLAGARPGAILALHDGSEPAHRRDASPCLAACERLLPALAERGLASRGLVRRGRDLGLDAGHEDQVP